MHSALVPLLLAVTTTLGLSHKDKAESAARFRHEQEQHLQAIVETCGQQALTQLIARERSMAVTRRPFFYHLESPTGEVREVTRMEFIRAVVFDCSLRGAAEDPILAPYLIKREGK
jgi:hypothetical protein